MRTVCRDKKPSFGRVSRYAVTLRHIFYLNGGVTMHSLGKIRILADFNGLNH